MADFGTRAVETLGFLCQTIKLLLQYNVTAHCPMWLASNYKTYFKCCLSIFQLILFLVLTVLTVTHGGKKGGTEQ